MNVDRYINSLGQEAQNLQLSGITGDSLATWRAEARARGMGLDEYLTMSSAGGVSKINVGGDKVRSAAYGQANAATFTINIIRTSIEGTDALLGALPAFIGLPLNLANNYYQLNGEFTAAGISVAVTRSANNLVLSFTDGTNTSTLTISAGDTAYNVFLEGLKDSGIDVSMIRYKVPLGSLNQLDQSFSLVTRTPFGKNTKNTMTPQVFGKPTNQQPNIVDITEPTRLGNFTGIVNMVAPGVTGEVGITLFSNEYVMPSF